MYNVKSMLFFFLCIFAEKIETKFLLIAPNFRCNYSMYGNLLVYISQCFFSFLIYFHGAFCLSSCWKNMFFICWLLRTLNLCPYYSSFLATRPKKLLLPVPPLYYGSISRQNSCCSCSPLLPDLQLRAGLCSCHAFQSPTDCLYSCRAARRHS